MPDGNYMLGELEVTVANGRCLLTSDLARGVETLAGSVLTMDRAVANLQPLHRRQPRHRRAPRQPQSRAHAGPRRHSAKIAVGRPANFNVFSADGTLLQTILHGRMVVPERC